jgi:hypothetical protein
MAVRLGELLVKAGLITPTDLDEALNSQVIFGGKLGTNLLEMGCLREEELVRFLSKATGVPPVKPEQMRTIPHAVTSLISAQLAARYRIVPLNLENRRLTVAMSDPTDFSAIDEIAFATGFIIIPMVASEASINRCLEKHYGIKGFRRTHRLRGQGRQRERQPDAPVFEELPENTGNAYEEHGLVEFPPLEEYKGFHVQDAPTTGESDAHGPEDSAAEQLLLRDLTPEAFSTRLIEAKDRDTVAELLLAYSSKFYGKAALFIVRGGSICGWKTMKDYRMGDLKGMEVPLDTPSVLRQVVQDKTFYLGPLADTAPHRRMRSAIGGEASSLALLIPLLLLKRVIAILYIEGSASTIGEHLVELQKIATKATMALEILILKSKITMT